MTDISFKETTLLDEDNFVAFSKRIDLMNKILMNDQFERKQSKKPSVLTVFLQKSSRVSNERTK